ncbi:MAG: PspC domain-containing protein [Dysgonomonas sp.]|nr:PspC domain-containing protein [Dysgonomonas sp.]
MKKVIEVNIGGINFNIEDDAYMRLKSYLTDFEASLPNKEDAREIMEDVESRVAELFQKEIKYPNQVVDMNAVNSVIACLGEVDKEKVTNNESTEFKMKPGRKLYRNPEDKKIAGVCGGLAIYFNIDSTLIRVIFILLIFFGFGSPFLIYFILWIVMPEANTVVQKLEMYGEHVTAENIKNYTTGNVRR